MLLAFSLTPLLPSHFGNPAFHPFLSRHSPTLCPYWLPSNPPDSLFNSPHMQLSGLNSPPYFEERSESIEPGSRSKHAALGMYLPSTRKWFFFIKEFFNQRSMTGVLLMFQRKLELKSHVHCRVKAKVNIWHNTKECLPTFGLFCILTQQISNKKRGYIFVQIFVYNVRKL